MQAPTFVPFWNIGQSMSSLKNELFKNLHWRLPYLTRQKTKQLS